MSKGNKKIGMIICFLLSLTPLFLGYLSISELSGSGKENEFLTMMSNAASQLRLSGVSSWIKSVQTQIAALSDGSVTLLEYVHYLFFCTTEFYDILTTISPALESVGSATDWLDSATGGMTSGLSSSYDDLESTLMETQISLCVLLVFPIPFAFSMVLSYLGGILGNGKKAFTPLVCNCILLAFAFFNCSNMPFVAGAYEVSVSIWTFVAVIASGAYLFLASQTATGVQGNSFPQQGGNSFPQQGGNSFPQQGGNSFPQQGGNSYPQQGGNSYPQQGSSSFQGSFPTPPQGVTPPTVTRAPAPSIPQNIPAPMVAPKAMAPLPKVQQGRDKVPGNFCVVCGKKEGLGKFCISCGRNVAETPEEEFFCHTCGTASTGGAFCGKCGNRYLLQPQVSQENPSSGFCGKCGEAKVDGTFCTFCGHSYGEDPVAEPVLPKGQCPHCGATDNAGAFCSKCGGSIKNGG